MIGVTQNYYRDWDDAASLTSSSYDRERMSPYRSENRGHSAASNGYSSDQGSVGSQEEGPTFMLEHLATFRVSADNELLSPADGMRRLLHMEKTTGIWTQKMILKPDKKFVNILSHENGDVVEQFPIELIREPTAFTSDDPKELYNNIFIFVVAEDPKRKYQNPTEMHIFQCLRINAKEVVEDMKVYMSGKSISSRMGRGGAVGRGEHIPPPPQEPAPEPPVVSNGRDYKEFSDSELRGEAGRGSRSERSSVSHNDDACSTSSEKYERDVAVLNSCFDDIERFIARLQHTASATRELERRRSSRKSKKKDIGDGLLSMRAKPPPEREFADIFQKFKLSFNLLAKLKSHIHDPNAPELVHFLFTPLALIVDASRDSNYGPNLPSKVLSPLLTRDAIDLLVNCLTSRETELWQSLGDPWTVPRDSWKYPVPPYHPVFSNGWAPEVTDESRDRASVLATEVASEAKMRHREQDKGKERLHHSELSDFYDSDRREPSPTSDVPPARYHQRPVERFSREERARSMTPPSDYHPGARIDVSQESLDMPSFEKLQKQWLAELKSRGAKIVQVTYPRTANNDKELTVVRGEFLEVMDDSRKWWKAINARGQIAHVPHTIVTPYSADQENKEDYRDDGRRGAAQPPPPEWGRKGKKGSEFTIGDSSEDDDSHLRKRSPVVPPVPPPLPPTDFTPSNTISYRSPKPSSKSKTQQTGFGTTSSHMDLMNEELRMVLETFRRRRPHLEINKTPDVYISSHSTPKEVQEWLKLKGFSTRILKQFDGVDGNKMFALSRMQLEKYCGKEEGARLDSQITIQRNISGYKTARSSELRQILAEQRKKIESSKDTNTATDNVTANFNFLQDYDQSGYQSEEDVEENDSDLGPNTGNRTLRDQIRNQKKKISGR
ncbi:epidermal growth factor receptor kinase substrate 8-like isoform X3 [Oratosquilla oratoria]|uniref:epidermal growth factor receptor kinase substrate 8-like isoform X3 n=1 Tax=Oratosquilla oratoria TaxID=337810 RepID=UPI003F761CFF